MRVRALRLPGWWSDKTLVPSPTDSHVLFVCAAAASSVLCVGRGGGCEPRIFGLLATPQLFFSGVQPLSHFLATFDLPYHLLCSALFLSPQPASLAGRLPKVLFICPPTKERRVRGCLGARGGGYPGLPELAAVEVEGTVGQRIGWSPISRVVRVPPGVGLPPQDRVQPILPLQI